MPTELRASRLPLLMRCSGSAYLETEDDESDNLVKANAWGHMVHKWKETGVISGPDKRTENAFRKAIKASAIDRLHTWPAGGCHEAAVAVRIDGNREIRNNHDGVFGDPRWITGTDDFHWYLLDELWIDDLKTGKWYDDPEEPGTNRFPQDVRSPQLRLYALAISRLLDYSGVVNVSLTHWPRLPLERRHAPPVRYWTSYTTDELDKYYAELESLYQRVQAGIKGDYSLTPGDHCRFCPARNGCFVAQPPEPSPFQHFKRN